MERARPALTREGRSHSDVAREAILVAERALRRAGQRVEAIDVRNGPDDVAASRNLAAEMERIRAR